MKKILGLLLSISFLFLQTACGAGKFLGPKIPSTPTITSTSTPTPTMTPTPTKTPYQDSAFSVKVVSYGEHGAMFELLFNGETKELEGASISVSTSQKNMKKEAQEFYLIDGKYLAEMTDAMYDLGQVDITLSIENQQNTVNVSTSINYNMLFPWLYYIYGQSGLSKRLSYPWNPNHNAWDLQPVSPEFPDGNGHPVTSPCRGVVFRSEIIPGSVDTHNLYIYCTRTGFFVQLGHMNNQVRIGDLVTSETIVGYLHWEKEISRPHNHTKIMRPNYFPVNIDRLIEANSSYVDIFSPQVQLGGEPLPYGFWLEETLPQTVKEMIDSGAFAWK